MCKFCFLAIYLVSLVPWLSAVLTDLILKRICIFELRLNCNFAVLTPLLGKEKRNLSTILTPHIII